MWERIYVKFSKSLGGPCNFTYFGNENQEIEKLVKATSSGVECQMQYNIINVKNILVL